MERYEGGCLCGDVRIVASGPPFRVGLCHCLDCQTHSGSAFRANISAPAAGFKLVKGAPRTFVKTTVQGQRADVEVDLSVRNDGKTGKLFTVEHRIVASDGRTVASRPKRRRMGCAQWWPVRTAMPSSFSAWPTALVD